MLKGINKIISPELLMILDKMGHGDEIVFSDGNFPGESIGRIVLRADACGVPELMKAVLELFPPRHLRRQRVSHGQNRKRPRP